MSRNGLRPRPDMTDIPGRDGKDGRELERGAAYEQQTTKNTLLL